MAEDIRANKASLKPTRNRIRIGQRAVITFGSVLGIVGLYYSLKYGVLGYSVTGIAPAIKDIPEIGVVFADLDTTGPTAYRLHYNSHHNLGYDLVGFASPEDLRLLCRRLHLYCEKQRVDDGRPPPTAFRAPQVVSLLKMITSREGNTPSLEHSHTEVYYTFNGLNPKTRGLTAGAFREKDGLFVIFGQGRPQNEERQEYGQAGIRD